MLLPSASPRRVGSHPSRGTDLQAPARKAGEHPENENASGAAVLNVRSPAAGDGGRASLAEATGEGDEKGEDAEQGGTPERSEDPDEDDEPDVGPDAIADHQGKDRDAEHRADA